MSKTVFIVITRGFITRNILRSKVLELLKSKGLKIIIFFPSYGKNEVPQYLKNEFEDNQVTLFAVEEPQRNFFYRKLYKLFSKLTGQLVFTLTTWKYNLIGKRSKMERAPIWSHIEKYVYTFLSKLHFLKTITRFIEQNAFRESYYTEYFNTYKPDVLFSTSIMSKLDIQFIKEAKRFGVKTVSMPKGWDNVAKLLYRVIPDVLIFHNNTMKKHAIKEQRIKSKSIIVTGFPQFDEYTDMSIIIPRLDYFKRIGLDSTRKLIFFGSEGSWSPEDYTVVEKLVSYVKDDSMFSSPISLVIRPHFSDIKTERFNCFKNIDNVWVDDSITISEFFWDNWDPSKKETELFINMLYHSEMTISIASTLALDACSIDKPVIAIGFGALKHLKTGIDITARLYDSDHYQSVLATNAVDFVKNEEALRESIQRYLTNTAYKHKERKVLVDKLCYRVDGNSSKRIVDAILS